MKAKTLLSVPLPHHAKKSKRISDCNRINKEKEKWGRYEQF